MRAERETTTTRATGRVGSAGAAFARAHGHVPLRARCERRDGGVGGGAEVQADDVVRTLRSTGRTMSFVFSRSTSIGGATNSALRDDVR